LPALKHFEPPVTYTPSEQKLEGVGHEVPLHEIGRGPGAAFPVA
jgi:hypothetical protein